MAPQPPYSPPHSVCPPADRGQAWTSSDAPPPGLITFGNLALNLPSTDDSSLSPLERIRSIRDTMLTEASAISRAASIASSAAADAAQWIANGRGCVVVTGVGKAGLIAQKLVATLSSTGSPAHFLHPSEAVHGDLGRVRDVDLVLALSNSGRSEEIVRIAPLLKSQAAGLIAITADADNPLARVADLVVPIGNHAEACPNGLAPTSSTAVMLAVGDAIAVLAGRLRGFSESDFGRFHPGGALGRKLAQVEEVMRPIETCRVSAQSVSIRDAISSGGEGRRVGAVMLTGPDGRLAGIFTDSDLARLLRSRREHNLDDPIEHHMTRTPVSIRAGRRVSEAIEILSSRHLSELPVIDESGRPLGLIDVTDLISAGDVQDDRDVDAPRPAEPPRMNPHSGANSNSKPSGGPDVLPFPQQTTPS